MKPLSLCFPLRLSMNSANFIFLMEKGHGEECNCFPPCLFCCKFYVSAKNSSQVPGKVIQPLQ